MTPEEKVTIQNAIIPEWQGIGAANTLSYLNKPGSALTPGWSVISTLEQKVNVHKAVLLAAMTATERGNLRALLSADTESAKDFAMLYNAADEFTINHATTRAMLDGLVTAIGLRSDTVAYVKRMGERETSRAEELIGRNLTIEDMEDVLR